MIPDQTVATVPAARIKPEFVVTDEMRQAAYAYAKSLDKTLKARKPQSRVHVKELVAIKAANHDVAEAFYDAVYEANPHIAPKRWGDIPHDSPAFAERITAQRDSYEPIRQVLKDAFIKKRITLPVSLRDDFQPFAQR